MNSFHYKGFPLTIVFPDTEEEVEVECSFTFFTAFYGSYYNPPEPASVEIVDITYKGVGIIDVIPDWQYRTIQDELLSCMLENY